jgi:hypothetical protein
VGNPCPLLLIGLPSSIVTFDEHLDLDDTAKEEEALVEQGMAPNT